MLGIWAWDADNNQWVKVAVNADGVLEVSMAVTNLDDLADVYVPSPTDGYILYWDETATKWKCEAAPAGAWASITGKPDSPSLEEMATEHSAAGLHTSKIVLVASDIPDLNASKITAGTLDAARLPTNIKTLTLTFIIDGGGSAITTGQKGHLEIPFACTIQAATLLADASGSIVIDIWKDTYANFPPTDVDSITASAPPTLSSAQKSQDTTLTGWTTAITAGDILAFNVDSVATVTRITLSLKVVKT